MKTLFVIEEVTRQRYGPYETMHVDGQDPRLAGRTVETSACRPPKKGELYLKPSGRRGVWFLLRADNDHKRFNRPIVTGIIPRKRRGN